MFRKPEGKKKKHLSAAKVWSNFLFEKLCFGGPEGGRGAASTSSPSWARRCSCCYIQREIVQEVKLAASTAPDEDPKDGNTVAFLRRLTAAIHLPQ